VHRLSADNQYQPIIGQFADNRYRPFDNRHRPIISYICFSKQNNKKMLLIAVHIDDSEITNDSVIINQSRIIFNIQQNKVTTKESMSGCYAVSNIVISLHYYEFMIHKLKFN